MAENAIAPFKGTLEWIGEPKSGTTRNGNEWKSVDFVLKYQDHKMEDRYLVLNAFGADKVDKLLSLPQDAEIKVVWWPEANQSNDGRWFPKNSAITITAAQPEAKSARTDIKAPSFPPNPIEQNMQRHTSPTPSSSYAPVPQPPLPEYNGPTDVPADDLPF